MRHLILGSSGQIGAHLTHYLKNQGEYLSHTANPHFTTDEDIIQMVDSQYEEFE